jgi:hypothetical protein
MESAFTWSSNSARANWNTRLRDTLDTLLTKIRLGELHEPDTIMRFVPRLVHRQAAA